MNIALIIAGGIGLRMQQEIPKQFMNVYDKPVIIYTLEAFEKHPEIDKIGVVCLDGWHDILKAYSKQYKLSKLDFIISGGENGQDSIRAGVFEAEKRYDGQDIMLVHDSIRPLVSQEIISDCVVQCKKYGSAISAVPCTTAVLKREARDRSTENVPRETLAITQTPQAFPVSKLAQLHRRALEKGIVNATASCSLAVELGETVHFSIGSELNLKLTTTNDFNMFKALLAAERKIEW